MAKTEAEKRYRASPAGRAAKARQRQRWKQTPAGRAAKAREGAKWKQTPAGKASINRARKTVTVMKQARRDRAPFVGVDGEGVGRGPHHKYNLFRMGERELYRGGQRLTTPELLQFILDHPAGDKLTAFAFDYDVTCILIDLPIERREHLLATYQQKHAPEGKRVHGGNRWTWLDFPGYGRFGVNWLTRNHFKVCRPHPDGRRRPNSSERASIRTIEDSWAFFATAFSPAIKAWEIGAEYWETIDRNKAGRASFETITPEIREYNRIECELLAQMMEKFRAACFEADIRPKTWNGAGKISAFLHRENGTVTAKELATLAPKALIEMAHAAYYGGRFEVTRIGLIALAVHEHDIHSAYPAQMIELPCLRHGKWKHVAGHVLKASPPQAIFVCPVRFEHPPETFLNGLAMRSKKTGSLSWPRFGNGVYWSVETRSAERRGAQTEYRAGWLYEKRCECRSFAKFETRYAQRMALGKLKGEPIKRGINGAYGKLAQRIGEPPYANPIWAGMITAATRAKINDAIGTARDPRNVIMIATDGIYTVKERLKVPIGEGLGEWGLEHFRSLFIVQPGLYWEPKGAKIKSRGISATTIAKYTDQFEAAWKHWADNRPEFDNAYATLRDQIASADDPARATMLAMRAFAGPLYPVINVQFPAFIGLRLAAHWNKPELAGQWQMLDRKISFDWKRKRLDHEWTKDGKAVILGPPKGDRYAHSAHYNASGVLSTSESWEQERMLFEANPDAAELIELITD